MRALLVFLFFPVSLLALPDGLEINTFAEPFAVEYPTGLTVSPAGTVYVSCDRNGSIDKNKNRGKVVACTDTDGDGRADKFVDFVPDVDSPRGGHFVRDTLYLIHPPYLSSFRDTDGDGVADEHTVLLKNIGFGIAHPRGADHTTNGCRMGIDGWLYISVGDFGMEGTTGTDGREVTLHGGGVARVRPDGTQLEVYSYHTRNHCDVAITPYLDLFTRDNTNDGKGWNIRVHHFTNGSEHGYPRLYKNFPDEAVKPLLDLGGGSGTGALYLHEPGFPGEFGDMLYTCDWTTGRIYQHEIAPFEATFTAEEEEFMELVRVVDMDVDGESRLYVCDWRNGKFKFAGEGVKVGMVQRIVPRGPAVPKWPDLAQASDPEIVGQLAHRSAVRRLEAQREILSRGRKPALAKALFDLLSDGTHPLYGRVAAIFTLKQLYGAEANNPLAEALGDDAIREFLLRAIADRRDELAGVPVQLFRDALSDPNPRVQLQAVIGAERLGDASIAPDLIKLGASAMGRRGSLAGNEDLRVPHACIRALVELQARDACLDAVADARTRAVALRALQMMHDPVVVTELGKLVSSADAGSELQISAMKALARLYHCEGEWDRKSWWGTRPDDRGPYFLVSDWEGTGQVRKFLELGFAALSKDQQSQMLEVFARNRIDVSSLDLGEQDPLRLALGAPTLGEGQVQLLTDAALDRRRPWAERLECFRALDRGEPAAVLRNKVGILSKWLREKKNRERAEREVTDFIAAPALILQLKGLRKIARQENDQMSRVAWRAILSFSQSPLIKERYKEQALAMAKDNPREVGYFLALADLQLPGFEEQIEAALESDNDTLRAAAERAREVVGGVAAGGGKMVAELDPAEVRDVAMTGKGDVSKGKELFVRQGCMACHAIDQEAVQKGPYLGSAGSKFTRDYLIESILDPNAVVAQGFQTELVTMKDGSVHLGFVTREEDGILEIRNIAGIAANLQVSEIVSREHQSNSMMPAGLAAALPLADFVSLVEYLVSLKE